MRILTLLASTLVASMTLGATPASAAPKCALARIAPASIQSLVTSMACNCRWTAQTAALAIGADLS
jgi:hypothetical protein